MASFAEWTKKRKKTSSIEPSSQFNNSFATVGDIAPIRSQTSTLTNAKPSQPTEKTKWYDNFLQLGDALSDGWQIGDITKTLLGTNTDIATNLLSGIVGWGEEAIKAGATATGTVTEKLGMDDTTKKIREFVATDLYDANAVSKQILSSNVIGNVPGLGGIGNAIKTIFTLEDFLNSKKEVDNGFGGKTIVREDNSILADDSDALLQSVGETGAKMGISALSGGLPISDIITGITVYGSQAEQAIKENATFSQATGSALISAAAEILFEKLSGGIKFGGVTLDDGLTRLVSKNISNVALKNGINLFKDIAGESLEEVLTEFVSKLGTSLYKEEDLTNILFSEEALQDYIKAGFSGGLMGGVFNVPKAVGGTANGIDSATGLNKSEQAVFDKEYNDRIAEAKKDGKKLSGKEKSNIFNSVMNDLERGRIGIDTIESVLGGDTYKQYQSAVEKDNKMKELQKEYDTLYRMKNGEKSDEQIDRQAELKQQLEEYRNTSKLAEIKDQLSNEVSELAKSGKLVESYNEKSRRSQAFEADLTQYDAKAQETIKRAIDSGILNNTNRTHEFVDMIAKLSADKGVLFDFTNNEKIKASGFAIEGKQVNGYVQGNNIAINIDSTSALNKVVGHEITHVLEGTELYTELANAVKELATTKGEYDSKLQSITKLYEGVEGANIENELTAELIGEYLFTDTDFINSLSAEKPTLFQKIFDEIKYLCKVATAGSKEAKQLEKVKKTFEEAYRQKNNTATEDGVKYSMAGVKSKTHDFSLLEQAIRLEDVGKATSEEIRQQTGWYRGYDGKWRYEIDDSKMEIDTRGKFSSNPDVRRYTELVDKVYFDMTATDSETQELQSLEKNLEGVNIQPKTLGEIIKHDELFEAYPKLKDVEVFFDMDTGTARGSYNYGLNAITINSRLKLNKDELKKTLIHEIQHAIQHIEGFSNGASLEYWDSAKNRYTPKENEKVQALKWDIYNLEKSIKKEFGSETWKNVVQYYDLQDAYFDDNADTQAIEKETERIETDAEKNGYTEALEKYYDLKRDLDLINLKVEQRSQMSNQELYLNTAGEVEARDVAARVDLTDEQRKENRPEIDRTNVVFADSGVSYSVSNDFKQQVDDVLNGTFDKNNHVYMGNTPQRLVDILGIQKLPMLVTNNHIYSMSVSKSKAKSDGRYKKNIHYHDLGDVVKQLPKLLNKPIMIIKSTTKSDNTNLVVVTSAVDKNGSPVVVALKPNGKGNYYNVELDSNAILSAYGKDNLINYINTARNEGRILYANKSSQQTNTTRVQFPNNVLSADYSNNLAHFKQIVNNNSMQKGRKNSLGDEYIAPVGNNVYGEDIKLQTASAEDIAPIGENVVRKETTIESNLKKQTTPEIDLFVKPNKTVETEQTETPEDAVPVEQSAETTETVEEKPKSKRLERAIRKIDIQLEQDKADLSEDFQQKKTELEKALENKATYISDKSLSLYKELQNLRKGVRASNDLAYFLDLGYEWKDLKSTLLKVHKWPDTVLNTESEIESTVREAIGREFDEKSYELDDLDTEYQKQLENLEKKAEEKRKKAGIAEQRRVKVQEYRTQMDDLIGDTTTWKDKKLGVQYQINTLRRNLRDIVRDKSGKRDLAKADAIYDELQGRYNHNEAELNREANRIKKVYADMKINKVEDQYIQMLGEYRHNPDTKLTLEEMQEFLEKNRDKIDEAKVDRTIELARETYDSLFGRVNAVLKEQGMREIPYRLGYFPHFTEEKQGRLAKLLNWKTHKTDIPTDIAGLTEQFNPNRSWQSFNKQRTGDDTDYSFTKGLDTYLQGALDWIYHIDDIQKRRAFENHIRYVHSEKGIQEKIDAIHNSEEYDADEMQEQIDAVFKEAGNPLNNFVTDFRTQTNTLAGKKSSMDRNMEAMLSREVYSTMTNISNRVTANMVVGSVSSALTNFIPITQSWGEVSPFSSIKAMKDTIKSAVRDDGTIDKSDFLTNRLKKSENLYQTTWDKVIDKAGAMMEIIDSFTSQTVWRSKYLENISNGMSENAAIKNADQFAENILAGRSRGNNPTIFDSKNPLIKTLTAFQLEVNNQYGYMFKDMPQDLKNKSIGKLVKGYGTMFLGAYVYNALYSALAGRDAAFDPISIVNDLLKDLFGDDEEEPADIIMNFTDNVLEEVPFVGGLIGGGRIPISSALPYDDGIYGAFEGVVTDVTEGNWKHLAKEVGESFVSYLLLPAGGGQIKKSIQGLQMFDDDFPIAGSYTDSGKLRFSVEETPGNIAQAAVFGQYASKTARQYFDEEHAPLSDKQTKELVDIQASMEEYWKYQKGLKKLGEDATLAEKVDYIADLEEFDTWQKNIMANNLTTRKEPIDLTGYDAIGDFEEFDYAMKNPEKYAISKAVGGYENYIKYSERLGNITAEKDKNGNAVSGSRKKKVARYINSLDIEFGEKMILYRSQYKSDDTYNAQIVEYLNGRDDITHQDKITILTELGFKVSDDGKVRW